MKDKDISSTYKVRVKTIERLRKRFVTEGFNIALNGKKQEVFREKIINNYAKSKKTSIFLLRRQTKNVKIHLANTINLIQKKASLS